MNTITITLATFDALLWAHNAFWVALALRLLVP
jgi:hypothetical protein